LTEINIRDLPFLVTLSASRGVLAKESKDLIRRLAGFICELNEELELIPERDQVSVDDLTSKMNKMSVKEIENNL
jgi:hypothetical protein